MSTSKVAQSSKLILRRGVIDSFEAILKRSISLQCSCNRNEAGISRQKQLQLFRSYSQAVPAIDASQMLSPAVRYIVGTHNITDISAIQATGPKNRLLKGDVLQYLETSKAESHKKSKASNGKVTAKTSPVPPVTVTHRPSYTDIPISSKRREQANEMALSKKTIPHVYFTMECLKPPWLLGNSDLINQAHMVKSIALAVEAVPGVNAVWLNDDIQIKSVLTISYTSPSRSNNGLRHKVISTPSALSLKEIITILEDDAEHDDKNLRSNINVYCTDGSDISGQTGILLPQQTVSLHFSSQQNKSYVTLTGDSRVVDVELVAKWLETLRRMYTMP